MAKLETVLIGGECRDLVRGVEPHMLCVKVLLECQTKHKWHFFCIKFDTRDDTVILFGDS